MITATSTDSEFESIMAEPETQAFGLIKTSIEVTESTVTFPRMIISLKGNPDVRYLVQSVRHDAQGVSVVIEPAACLPQAKEVAS